jgi:uncharacterized protein (DUF1919 family)
MVNIFDISRHSIHNMLLPLTSYILKKKLKNNNFSIIASNCVGTRIYRELNLPYTSPFIGLFICAPDYIKLLKDPKRYLQMPIKFIEKSKYSDLKKDRAYPIGLLGDEIELHFLNYESKEDALEKWNRRLKRINWDNLYVTFTDRDFCTSEILQEFDSLPFQHKVCFTANNNSKIHSAVWVKDDKNQPSVRDLYTHYHTLKKYFNFMKWLNQ